MKSTPARMLHQDQLLVDRYAVNKINKVEFPLPQNTVAVELTNQMTDKQSTRNLRWDEQVTTEEPFEVEIDGPGLNATPTSTRDTISAEKLKAEVIAKMQDWFAAGKVKLIRGVLEQYGDGAKSFPEIPAERFVKIDQAIKSGEIA